MAMLSEGAVTYQGLLDAPVSDVMLIHDRLVYVLKEREKARRRVARGRS